MPVTSIRLETELKDRLKVLAGKDGYQKLVRDMLWRFVEVTSLRLVKRIFGQP